MIYKKLNSNGTKWVICEYDPTKKEIQLYKITLIGIEKDGIGLY